jgi:nucleotide-binding universal stress UspA family protein
MMTSQILVPLDGSALAEQALPCAVTLARGLPARLILFRAVSIPLDLEEIVGDVFRNTEAQIEQLKAEANNYLGQVASRLQELRLDTRMVVEQGPAAKAIVDYAEQMAVQKIVMSTHGYSGFSRWRHGSVAERVLQAASVPVFLVRAQEKTPGDVQGALACQRILVPLDGSPVAEQVLPVAASVAQALEAEMVLLRVPIAHVSGSFTGEWYMPLEGTFETAKQIAEAYLDHVAERLRAGEVQVTTATRTGGVANAIIEYAEANQIDLIAMCTHGRTGLARWSLGSVADRVLRAGHIPLLLVRAR